MPEGVKTVTRFQDLIVWQKAMLLAERIYRATASFPTSELYGLTSQMRRAAVSVPSNIAEGFNRRTSAEFAQFLSIAYGSLAELETQLILAGRLNLVAETESRSTLECISEIGRILNALKTKISQKRISKQRSEVSDH